MLELTKVVSKKFNPLFSIELCFLKNSINVNYKHKNDRVRKLF